MHKICLAMSPKAYVRNKLESVTQHIPIYLANIFDFTQNMYFSNRDVGRRNFGSLCDVKYFEKCNFIFQFY